MLTSGWGAVVPFLSPLELAICMYLASEGPCLMTIPQFAQLVGGSSSEVRRKVRRLDGVLLSYTPAPHRYARGRLALLSLSASDIARAMSVLGGHAGAGQEGGGPPGGGQAGGRAPDTMFLSIRTTNNDEAAKGDPLRAEFSRLSMQVAGRAPSAAEWVAFEALPREGLSAELMRRTAERCLARPGAESRIQTVGYFIPALREALDGGPKARAKRGERDERDERASDHRRRAGSGAGPAAGGAGRARWEEWQADTVEPDEPRPRKEQ
jgi:hypothetical protein